MDRDSFELMIDNIYGKFGITGIKRLRLILEFLNEGLIVKKK